MPKTTITIKLDDHTASELDEVRRGEAEFGRPVRTMPAEVVAAVQHWIADRLGHVKSRRWRLEHGGESIYETLARLKEGDSTRPPPRPVKKTRPIKKRR